MMMGQIIASTQELTMQASQLIKRLDDLILVHGDLNVVMDDDTEPAVEYNTDPEPAFVIS